MSKRCKNSPVSAFPSHRSEKVIKSLKIVLSCLISVYISAKSPKLKGPKPWAHITSWRSFDAVVSGVTWWSAKMKDMPTAWRAPMAPTKGMAPLVAQKSVASCDRLQITCAQIHQRLRAWVSVGTWFVPAMILPVLGRGMTMIFLWPDLS